MYDLFSPVLFIHPLKLPRKERRKKNYPRQLELHFAISSKSLWRYGGVLSNSFKKMVGCPFLKNFSHNTFSMRLPPFIVLTNNEYLAQNGHWTCYTVCTPIGASCYYYWWHAQNADKFLSSKFCMLSVITGCWSYPRLSKCCPECCVIINRGIDLNMYTSLL